MAEFSRSLVPLALCIAIGICYWNALQCGFVFDDISAIKDNKDLRPQTPITNLIWNDFWGTPMHKEKSHKSYRPLCVLTFRWNYLFGNLNAWGYHLVNVLLHCVVCLLYFRFCGQFVSCGASFLAAMMFAVHPIHTEAVTGVVGRAELLSSICFLAAMQCYIKCTGYRKDTDWRYLVLTVLCVMAAMLCKEQGITVVGVCCLYEVFIAQRMSLGQIGHVLHSVLRGRPEVPRWLVTAAVRSLVLVLSTALLLLARVKMMGGQLPVFTRFDNPASVSDTPSRQLTFNYLVVVNAWLLFYPFNLCCDWTMGTIPVIKGLADPRNLATVAMYCVLFKLLGLAVSSRSSTGRALLMSLSLLILPFIPASNLFFPVGFVVAERILYMPSMGFCLMLATGFETLASHRHKWRQLLWFCMIVLLLSHTVKTYQRNWDWHSDLSLFQSALRVNQNNAKLYNNVGHALENQEKYTEALEYFTQAARVEPTDIGAHINVGRTLHHLNESEAAEKSYRKAMELLPPVKPGETYTARVAPNHLHVFVNLGRLIAQDESRLAEADALYRTAISMRADYMPFYINRGDVLMRMKRTGAAEEQYELALRYENDNPDIYYNLGVVHLEQDRKKLALSDFNKALDLDENHRQSLFNSAVLMQELGDASLRPIAVNRLKHLMQFEAENSKIYFNLGMLSMDDKSFTEAEHWFTLAIKYKEDFRSALFNLALLLVNDLQRPLDAVPVLKQLLQFYPDHTKGLILMGDLNINHLKDIPAAKENFETILKIEPHNVQANHNLCVVYVEEGNLKKAEQCLIHAVSLAPREQYIRRHLAVVRSRMQQAG